MTKGVSVKPAIRKRQCRRFLIRLAQVGNYMAAAVLVVGHDNAQSLRGYISYRERTDFEFAEEIQQALFTYTDKLEAEADRRGVDGVSRYKFFQGQPILDPETKQPVIEREYSDKLLIERLRALAPAKYARRSITAKINLSAHVQRLIKSFGFVVRQGDTRYLTDPEIISMREILAKIEKGRTENPYDPWHDGVKQIEVKAMEIISDEKAQDQN